VPAALATAAGTSREVEEERPDDMVVLTPEKIILYAPRNAEPVHREQHPVEIGTYSHPLFVVGLGLLLSVLDRIP
jgi:hypothetical protein